MLPDISDCSLLIIDAQEKLLKAMKEDVATKTAKNIAILAQLANDFNWPIFYTEQYPKGLGATHPEIKQHLTKSQCIPKMTFSCFGETDFCQRVAPYLKGSVIVVGMETHICVLNTLIDAALDKHFDETDFYIPMDAVCSRQKIHWKNALNQMNNMGLYVTNTETVVFQMLEEATGDLFKKYSALIK